jgi:hypothetical protein
VGGVLLPVFVDVSGELLAAAVYSASFAEMTDPKRIPNEWWIGATGIGVGLVVVYTTPFVGGSGGKSGTIAFGSCPGIHGILRTRDSVQLSRRGYRPPREETTRDVQRYLGSDGREPGREGRCPTGLRDRVRDVPCMPCTSPTLAWHAPDRRSKHPGTRDAGQYV